MTAVGSSLPMPDAAARVTGTLPYASSLRLPGMLWARVLRSRYGHARLASVDATAALALPGVVAVLTAADFDAPGAPSLYYGLKERDQPIVAHERARFAGEPVAVVAAETPAAAEEALEHIWVDYEELPAVTDVLAAREPGAPVLHREMADNSFAHAKLRHGDLAAGFAAADEILAERYTSPIAFHAALEPHVAIAQWHDGRLTVHSTTQAPFAVRAVLAEIFDLDPEHVRIVVPPLGGGYGGKGHIRIEPMAAALARLTGGRPVRLALMPSEQGYTVTKHAAVIDITTGFKGDGTFTARQVTIYWNGGAYADASPLLVPAGMVRSAGPYRIPAVHLDSYGVYTNLPPAGAFRGAMSSQATWAYESHLDSIAHRLGADPLALRRQNLLQSGDTFATGETLHDLHFVECLDAAAAGLDKERPPEAPERPSARRGRGVAVMMKSTMATSRSECRLVLDGDGHLSLYTSAVEMGQGAHTVLRQIAAEAAGLAPAAVTLIGPDTAATPFDSSTSASRATSMMGNAILDGARQLIARLMDLAAPILEVTPEELVAAGEHIMVAAEPAERIGYGEVLRRNHLTTLEVRGAYATRGGLDPESGQGLATPHWHQGAGACDVEVDLETGKLTILRYFSTAYAGRVINPALARLQNDGNVIFGLGPALYEEAVAADGQIVNPTLAEYKIPTIADVPARLGTAVLEGDGGEIHGIGEMTLPPVAPAIANALFHAAGIRIFDLPITPEKVLRALQELGNG